MQKRRGRYDDNRWVVELRQSKNPNVFNVLLRSAEGVRGIGKLDQRGCGKYVATVRHESLHLHRNSQSVAVNAEILENPDCIFKRVVIPFVYVNGQRTELVTTRTFILENGKRDRQGGWEFQYYLPMKLWGEEKALRFERERESQGELFQ